MGKRSEVDRAVGSIDELVEILDSEVRCLKARDYGGADAERRRKERSLERLESFEEALSEVETRDDELAKLQAARERLRQALERNQRVQSSVMSAIEHVVSTLRESAQEADDDGTYDRSPRMSGSRGRISSVYRDV